MTKFLEIFNQLIDKKGIKRNKVFTDLKLGKTSYANWETRDTIPGGDTLIKLAVYFNVTVEYLLGEVTEQEMQHAKKYAVLDDTGKDTVDKSLEVEYRRCNAKHGIEVKKLEAAARITGGGQRIPETPPESIFQNVVEVDDA